MILDGFAQHGGTPHYGKKKVRPVTIIVSRMVLLWQPRHPLVELHGSRLSQ
jgi:hypothetical protein